MSDEFVPAIKANEPRISEFAFALGQGVVEQLRWEQLPTHIISKFHRNGCHSGYRNLAEAQKVYAKCIPAQAKMLGSNELQNWMIGKDFSHIKAHVNGGGFEADNIVLENSSINRARGGHNMVSREINAAKVDGLLGILKSRELYRQAAGNAARGAIVGGLFAGGTSAIKNIWTAVDGEISWGTAGWNIASDARDGAVVAGVIAGAITLTCVVLPPVVGVLGAAGPLLATIGIGTTAWDIGSFAWNKLFSQKPKASLLIQHRKGELLHLLEPLKLVFPPKFEVYSPTIYRPDTHLYIPPKHPLVYSLED